jgi:hypothetical protein
MASYASYKKVTGDQISSTSIPDSKLVSTAFKNYTVQWIRGCLGVCTPGCCCLWTVPSGVRRVTFELWGAGGNGAGACSNGRCQHYAGAQGGYYNIKTISVQDGWTYTICAGGVYPCNSIECNGCEGCTTYVNGCGLSNFCAIGGCAGCADGAWSTGCFSDWGRCCVSPGAWGGDFSMGNHRGGYHASWGACHCYRHMFCSTGAPFLGGGNVNGEITECWIRCGCWNVPYAHGAQSAMTTYCGGCCGQGGTGGSGVVKVTYF